MTLKIKEFFLLIFLVLLQSCSGGKIGNFLESSFDNLNDTGGLKKVQNNSENKKVIDSKKEINKNNFEEKKIERNKKVINSKKREINKKSIEEIKMKKKERNILVNNIDVNLEKELTKTKKLNKKNKLTKKKSELESYKIIFILKEVDPKNPIKELSNILRNSDVNFEIEKIERYLNSNNKIIDED